jgi:glycosyltransferase involved in cell wall biosynthesis
MESFTSFGSFLNNNTISSAKKLWQLEKKVIVCGYNASNIVRHEMIIDSLNVIKSNLSNYKVIFPMTYGDRSNERKILVKEKLKKTSFDSLVLENFLTIEKLQALRLCADVFIHIQERDQMASSMLEHLAAGSVVITGKWLPYDNLIEKGVYFIRIEKPEDLSGILSQVIDNLQEHKNKSKVNREIILEMMSWDSIKKNWFKYYRLEEKSSINIKN